MAAALSLTCLLSAASCSLPGQGSGSGSKGEKPKQSASEVLKHTYTAEPIGSTPDVQYVNTITRLGDTDNVLITGSSDKDDGEELFITDLSFDSFTPIIPKYERGKNSELYCNTSAALDGTIFHVANITDHGDMEMPDWSSPDFDFDSWVLFFKIRNQSGKPVVICIIRCSDSNRSTSQSANLAGQLLISLRNPHKLLQ